MKSLFRASCAQSALLAIVLTQACLCATPTWANDRIHLQLRWQHQFQFAGYYLAIDRGYYASANLDVDVVEATGARSAISEVVSGRAEYGVGSSDLVLARARGQKVVALAAFFQHSPLVILSLSSTAIDSVHDLAGKRVAIENEAADLVAYLKSEGLAPSSYHAMPHAQSVQDLLDGRIDAMSAYQSDEPYELGLAKRDIRIFSPRASGIDFYGDTLFTSETELAQHPDRVRAFIEATRRGWNDALADPEAGIDAVLRRSQRHSREHLRYEAQHTVPLISADIVEMGYMNPARWRNIADTYASLGLIAPNVDLGEFVYRAPTPGIPNWIFGVVAGSLVVLFAIGAGWLRAHRLARELATFSERELRMSAERTENQRQLVAILSHEFRNPLAGIDRAANLLEIAPDLKESASAQRLASIRAQVARLHMVVDNILLTDPIHGESLKPRLDSVSVAELFGGVRDALTSEMADRVVLAISPALLEIRVDARLLGLALSNLIDNALRYAPAASPVRLSAHAEAATVTLSVEDEGPGAPPDVLERLGTPYTSKLGSKRGSGLGYYFTRLIVLSHGGEIVPANRENGGFSVSMRFPVA